MLKRLFLSVFILQAHIGGLVLIMLPWGPAWESNFFLASAGALHYLADLADADVQVKTFHAALPGLFLALAAVAAGLHAIAHSLFP